MARRDRARQVRRALLLAAVAAVLPAVVAGTAAGATTAVAPPGTLRTHVSPLRDPSGLHPGLTRVPRLALAAARRLVAKVRTATAGPRTGYARDEFGPAWTDRAQGVPWAGNGCDTRDDILRRDMTQVEFRAGTGDCVVVAGRLANPYLGDVITFLKVHATRVQIDHVIPLALAWDMGAARWTKAKRVRLANDPLNLLAVDQRSNAQKSDGGPAEWLPARPTIRCAYSVRVAQVARRYAMPVTRDDKATMRTQCTG